MFIKVWRITIPIQKVIPVISILLSNTIFNAKPQLSTDKAQFCSIVEVALRFFAFARKRKLLGHSKFSGVYMTHACVYQKMIWSVSARLSVYTCNLCSKCNTHRMED